MKFLSGIECWFTLPTFVSITMSEFTSSSFQLPYSHQGSSRSSILCGPTTGAASAFVSQRQWATQSFPQEIGSLHSLSQELIVENPFPWTFGQQK